MRQSSRALSVLSVQFAAQPPCVPLVIPRNHRRIQRRLHNPPITILHPPIQLHLLQHRRKPTLSTPLTIFIQHIFTQGLPLFRFFWVFDVEDGFAGVDELSEGCAFLFVDALFVYTEVDDGEDEGDDVAGVFEAEGEV